MLQQLITNASANGEFQHPICPTMPCPILQYADDTLIILKADETQLTALKSTLQAFSAATGLHINFEKSTFLPICIDSDSATSLAATFGCPVSSFPQPYLGLPLSTTKLCTTNFLPLIAASDKYLAGWRGHLLNEMGRSVLVSSVLASSSVYAMSSLLLFKGTADALVKIQRAFLWTGENSCRGGQCKVAWEDVCLPKDKGGLGIPDLTTKTRASSRNFFSSSIVLDLLLGLNGYVSNMGGQMTSISVMITLRLLPFGKTFMLSSPHSERRLEWLWGMGK